MRRFLLISDCLNQLRPLNPNLKLITLAVILRLLLPLSFGGSVTVSIHLLSWELIVHVYPADKNTVNFLKITASPCLCPKKHNCLSVSLPSLSSRFTQASLCWTIISLSWSSVLHSRCFGSGSSPCRRSSLSSCLSLSPLCACFCPLPGLHGGEDVLWHMSVWWHLEVVQPFWIHIIHILYVSIALLSWLFIL